MSRIFISYKREDKDKVFPLKDKIEAATGEKCWIDLDGIESDAQFVNVIMQAIDNAEIFLFMFSKEHAHIEDYDTDWTIREINYAQRKHKRIVIINIDQTPLVGWFEFMFSLKQQIDATNYGRVEKLTMDIKRWLHKENSTNKREKQSSKNIFTSTQRNLSNDEKIYTIQLLSYKYGKLLAVKYVDDILKLGLTISKNLVDSMPVNTPVSYSYLEATNLINTLKSVGVNCKLATKNN